MDEHNVINIKRPALLAIGASILIFAILLVALQQYNNARMQKRFNELNALASQSVYAKQLNPLIMAFADADTLNHQKIVESLKLLNEEFTQVDEVVLYLPVANYFVEFKPYPDFCSEGSQPLFKKLNFLPNRIAEFSNYYRTHSTINGDELFDLTNSKSAEVYTVVKLDQGLLYLSSRD